MPFGIPVIPYIPVYSGVDGVVLSEADVLAGMPFRAALAEDDRAGDDVLRCGGFEAEASAGGVFGAVGLPLGRVVGGADLGVGEGSLGVGGGVG